MHIMCNSTEEIYTFPQSENGSEMDTLRDVLIIFL